MSQFHSQPLVRLSRVICRALACPLIAERAAPPNPHQVCSSATTAITSRRARSANLQPVLAKRGIDLTYTDNVGCPRSPRRWPATTACSSTPTSTKITPEQEKALLDYVAGGKGFIPLHCASYCFLNSPKYIALVGAQFQQPRHRHLPHDDRRARPPDHEGLRRLRELGRDLRPHQAQREGPHRPGIPRRRGAARSRGPGCARTARAASSTPPGATTTAPGATPASRTWSSAASAGPSAAIPAVVPRLRRPAPR